MTAAGFDLLCAGQLFTDVIMGGLPAGGPRLGRELHVDGHLVTPGGIANAAVLAARLGAFVAMAADAGADSWGRSCLDAVAARGVDVAACRLHEGWAQPITVALTWDGDRAQVTSTSPVPGESVLRSAALPTARCVICHLDDRPMPWIAAAASAGSEVLADVGWDDTGAWDLDALPSLADCTGLTPNLDEALAYTRTPHVDAALDRLAERVPLVVITMAGDGVAALDSRTGERVRLPAAPVELRNANGAGDSFAAGLAVAHALPLETRLRFASLVAAWHVSNPLGILAGPRLRDVADLADSLGAPWDGAVREVADRAR